MLTTRIRLNISSSQWNTIPIYGNVGSVVGSKSLSVWPSTYPTKTLQQWEAIVKVREPIVFQKPGKQARAPRDFINQSVLVQQTGKRKKGKKKRDVPKALHKEWLTY